MLCSGNHYGVKYWVMTEPRILVFGCGGIGGYVSGMLTKSGADVTIVDIWPEHVTCMQESGLQVKCAYNAATYSVPVKALHLHRALTLPRADLEARSSS